MTKIFALFFVVLIGLGLAVQDADARRLGGGSSIGRQTSSPQKQAQPPAQAPTPAAPAPSGASRWLGPLAGLAAGGLLASLFMGEGAGGAFGSMLMILALVAGVFIIFRMLRRPQPQPVQYAGTVENHDRPAGQRRRCHAAGNPQHPAAVVRRRAVRARSQETFHPPAGRQ